MNAYQAKQLANAFHAAKPDPFVEAFANVNKKIEHAAKLGLYEIESDVIPVNIAREIKKKLKDFPADFAFEVSLYKKIVDARCSGPEEAHLKIIWR